MLIEFRVENHRSIREEQAITLEAGRVGDAGDPTPREVGSVKVLPAAAIYGANASGKSNVLEAFAFMCNAVLSSHRTWQPEGGVPRDPFAWGASRTEPSLFEVTVVVEGVRYQYGFVADDERFVEEWLFAWPKGRKQTWFQRDGDTFKFGEHLRGENKLVEQVTRPNALFLSASAQNRHDQLASVFGWFVDVRTANVRSRRPDDAHLEGLSMLSRLGLNPFARRLPGDLSDSDPMVRALRDLLKEADIGIIDLKSEIVEFPGPRSAPFKRIVVRHQSSADDAWLPLAQESQGTLTLFRMGPVFLNTLATGGLLLVDELESSLHPLLAAHIIRQFNDPRTNPKNAQLLFTTHDTNLLGNTTGATALRRDQVWLTEKDNEGATCVYPLTDYKPRKSENLERGYLQGRYGAIPFLGALTPVAE